MRGKITSNGYVNSELNDGGLEREENKGDAKKKRKKRKKKR